jgi:DNA-binding protein H-NS
MAKTYIQLQKEISQLQLEAKNLMAAERPGVIESIRGAIQNYELTPPELFGAENLAAKANANTKGKVNVKAKAKAKAKAAGSTTKSKGSTEAKFTDGAGHFWVGRGKRPDWLRDALASGRSLSEFAVGAPQAGTGHASPLTTPPQAAPEQAPASKAAKKAKKAKTAKAAKTPKTPTTVAPAAKANGKASALPTVKYKDAAGNSWSGRGPRPKWLKDAVASGTSLESLTA